MNFEPGEVHVWVLALDSGERGRDARLAIADTRRRFELRPPQVCAERKRVKEKKRLAAPAFEYPGTLSVAVQLTRVNRHPPMISDWTGDIVRPCASR